MAMIKQIVWPICIVFMVVISQIRNSESLTCECSGNRLVNDEITASDLLLKGIADNQTEAEALVRDFRCVSGKCRMKDVKNVNSGKAKGMQSVCLIKTYRNATKNPTKKDCFYRWSKVEDKVANETCKQAALGENLRFCTKDSCNAKVECQVTVGRK